MKNTDRDRRFRCLLVTIGFIPTPLFLTIVFSLSNLVISPLPMAWNRFPAFLQGEPLPTSICKTVCRQVLQQFHRTGKEDRFPGAQELDAAVPRPPLLIIHWGGQYGAADTLALKKAGNHHAKAKAPPGSQYLRNPITGDVPDGRVLHYPAIYSVYQAMLTKAETVECTKWGMRQFASVGVTCIHDSFCDPRYAAVYVGLEREGRLNCRVRVYPYVKNLKHCRIVIDGA